MVATSFLLLKIFLEMCRFSLKIHIDSSLLYLTAKIIYDLLIINIFYKNNFINGGEYEKNKKQVNTYFCKSI